MMPRSKKGDEGDSGKTYVLELFYQTRQGGFIKQDREALSNKTGRFHQTRLGGIIKQDWEVSSNKAGREAEENVMMLAETWGITF
jgi:hypothetical protein